MIHILLEAAKIIVMTGIMLVIVNSVLSRNIVHGQSMIPTLQPNEYIFASKVEYIKLTLPSSNAFYITGNLRKTNIGDIVVFNIPEYPDAYIVKRVIALPGDEVYISEGIVYVNGVPETSYTNSIYTSEGNYFDFSTGSTTVPEGKLIVMGDNRTVSEDSRHWGYLDIEHIIGRVIFVIEM